jgi:hypothetical protein
MKSTHYKNMNIASPAAFAGAMRYLSGREQKIISADDPDFFIFPERDNISPFSSPKRLPRRRRRL